MSFSSIPVTVPIETAVTVPMATITSVYGSAATYMSSIENVMMTATDTNVNESYAAIGQELQATMSYYSLLGVQATMTDPDKISAVASQAAEASAAMHKVYQDNSFYKGNKPSLGGNVSLAVLFGLFLIFQIIFGIYFKQWWFFVCYFCGLLLEVLGYAGRIWSHYNIRSFDAYVMQLVCITLAPCFLMAGIYYLLAQLTVIMGQHFSMLKPMQYSLIFIICDLISIILQAAGGGMASAELSDHESTRAGSNVMVGGLAYQVFSMTLFQYMWYVFCYRCYKCKKKFGDEIFNPQYTKLRSRKAFIPLFYIISFAVLFIYIRSIYRLIEMAEGFTSSMANNETLLMCLESLMVCLSSLLLTVLYPGFAYGPKSYIPIDMNVKSSFTAKTERFKDHEQIIQNRKLSDTEQ